MISEMWQRKAYILPTTMEMKSFMEKKNWLCNLWSQYEGN